MTPTLFYIAAIVGLKPIGKTYDPNFMAEYTIEFDTSEAAFTTHIEHCHNKESDEISNQEHISFLALWLSHYVFLSRSLQVPKNFLTMVNQVHARHYLCLREVILGNLYESLGEVATDLKNTKNKGNLLLAGPFWFLQLWLNATFEASLLILNPINMNADVIRNRRVEGTRMVKKITSDEVRNLKQTFTSYVTMSAKRYNFTPSMAPFACRKYGPEWFTRKFPLHQKTKKHNLFPYGKHSLPLGCYHLDYVHRRIK